ncbi:MAG: TonB-dependent receptor, partial [Opitutaceae bacterium]|nr:TonB-dependent receptor [Opitutaceae bacterium]
SATVGEHRARGGEVSATLPSDDARDAFRLDASAYATDGVRLVRDPGRIDVPADLETSRAGFAWARRISEITTLETSVRAWSEERGNGTPYQRNASEERSVSARLAGAPRDSAVSAWSVTAYAQDQDYRSTFSGVNATRTAETPASDQYAVPATAAGAAAQLIFGEADADSATTTFGVDARHVDGQTRERFFFTGGGFARERRAGGVQNSAGLFATHARPLAPDLTLTTGARLDAIRRADGFRRETVRATGVVLRDDAYADRDDLALSPSAGLAWRATDTLTARAAAYSAYRSPTLNELYRPFRVGPVETRANPALDPETLLGGELGLDYAAPGARGGLRATVFENALSDAIANVSLPAPANTRERRNLDSTRVRGLELGGFWQPVPSLRLDADYLLSDARVRSGGEDAAALDGRRLAQVPRHTVTAGAAWQAAAALEFDLRARWVSSQFEDDLNNPALELDAATRIDFSVRIDLAPRLRLVLAVENLFDAEIETSRTDSGVVGLAPPRLVRAELTYAW